MAHEKCETISITTDVSFEGANIVRCKATVVTPKGTYTGHAEELRDDRTSMVNRTSAVENVESSAIGRALGFAGYGIVDSVATADEIIIAKGKEAKLAPAAQKAVKVTADTDDETKREIMALIKKLGFDPKGKSEWDATVKAMTDLELLPENYENIVGRLNTKLSVQ